MTVHFVDAKHRFCWRKGISITKLAMELHILPIRFRILDKISLTIFKCIHGNAPDYTKNLTVLSRPQTGFLLLLLSTFPISQGWPQHIIILHIFLSSMPQIVLIFL